jgi:hypothetical protein
MTRKIFSFKKFLEIIWKAYRIELDYISCEALNTAWVDISVDKVNSMQELYSQGNLSHDIENFLWRKLLFTEGFPIRMILRNFHLNENQTLVDDKVTEN